MQSSKDITQLITRPQTHVNMDFQVLKVKKYSDCTQLFAFSHKTVLSVIVPILSIVSILGSIQQLHRLSGQNIVRQLVRVMRQETSEE